MANTEAGTAYVTIIPSAKGFARNLQKDIAKEFANSGLDKLIADALGKNGPIKLPYQPVPDEKSIPDEIPVPKNRRPKLKTELDPLVEQFQAQVKRDLAAMAKHINAEIPVGADTAELRGELATQIAAIQKELKAEIPTEPAGMREYEAKLSGLLASAQRRVKAEVDVVINRKQAAEEAEEAARAAEHAAPPIELKVDIDRKRFRSAMGRVFEGAMDVLSGLASNAVKSVNQLAAGFATNVASAVGTIATTGTATTVATGGLNLLAGALIVAAGAAAIAATGFVALAPIVLIAGGAFGSAATAAVGLGGAMAVLKLGMTGIGDALGEIGKNGKVSAETMEKLSPNARALVREFEKLKGPLDDLRRFVQDRLLEGMNKQVRDLAAKWLPALKPMLGDLADRFNNFAEKVFAALGKPEFIENIGSAMSGFGDAVDRIGLSMPGLIDAFGRLAKASKPFLKELGDIVGDLADKFSAWIKSADESGKLDQFMKDAAQALRDIWDIGGLVVGIIGDIIEIFFPTSKDASDSVLGGVKAALQDLKDWLGDPENQKKIQDFLDKMKEAAIAIGDAALTIAGWVDKVQEWVDKIEGWKQALSDAWDSIKQTAEEKWNGIVAFFTGLPGRVGQALSELPSKVREKFVEMAGQAGHALGTAIGSWINLVTGMPGRAANALRNLPGQLASIWQRAKPVVEKAVGELISGAVRLVKELPGKASDALKDIGSTLLRAGRALIDGLIQGIREKVPALDGFLGWISDKIPDWKGPYDRDKVLLLPAGRAIMTGLVTGISDEVPTLRGQLGDVTDLIAGTSTDLASASAWGRSPGGVPSPGQLTAVWVGGDGDPIMRAIKEHTRIYYGGSAQAALGS